MVTNQGCDSGAAADRGIAGFYFFSESRWCCAWRAARGDRRGSVVDGPPSRESSSSCSPQEAVVETKKVVWPTRKESLQTTGRCSHSCAMAVFLWLTDKSLEYLMYDCFSDGKSSQTANAPSAVRGPRVLGFREIGCRHASGSNPARGVCQENRENPGADGGSRRDEGRQKNISGAKFFPGYVLVEMDMTEMPGTW